MNFPIELGTLGLYFMTALVLALTPGPGILFVLAQTVKGDSQDRFVLSCSDSAIYRCDKVSTGSVRFTRNDLGLSEYVCRSLGGLDDRAFDSVPKKSKRSLSFFKGISASAYFAIRYLALQTKRA